MTITGIDLTLGLPLVVVDLDPIRGPPHTAALVDQYLLRQDPPREDPATGVPRALRESLDIDHRRVLLRTTEDTLDPRRPNITAGAVPAPALSLHKVPAQGLPKRMLEDVEVPSRATTGMRPRQTLLLMKRMPMAALQVINPLLALTLLNPSLARRAIIKTIIVTATLMRAASRLGPQLLEELLQTDLRKAIPPTAGPNPGTRNLPLSRWGDAIIAW